MTCPINGDCYIECIDHQSCMDLTINATQQNGNFELLCEDEDDIGDSICRDIEVYGSTLATNTGTEFLITCGRDMNGCRNMLVNCAQGMNCQIDCHTKNKPAGDDGARGSCLNSKINGPTGYDLRVECDDNNGCQDAIINGTDSKLLNITCMDISACMDITVYCPPNSNGDKNCILTGESKNINRDIQIYAMYGWNDVVIDTMGTLWTADINGGSMYCGNDYEFECILDNWNCSNNNDTCINVATLSPSNSPSIEPSVSPTYEPSIQPSNNPSVDPTTTHPTTSNPTTTIRITAIPITSGPTTTIPTAAPVKYSGSTSSQKQIYFSNYNMFKKMIVLCITLVIISCMIMIVCIIRSKRNTSMEETKKYTIPKIDIVSNLKEIEPESKEYESQGNGDGYELIKGKSQAMNESIQVNKGRENRYSIAGTYTNEGTYGAENEPVLALDARISVTPRPPKRKNRKITVSSYSQTTNTLLTPQSSYHQCSIHDFDDIDNMDNIGNDDKKYDDKKYDDLYDDMDIVDDINDYKETDVGIDITRRITTDDINLMI